MTTTFRAVLETNGKTATGIEVPPEVIESLGSGKRPKVKVTFAGYTYPITVGVMGGRFLLPVSAKVREAAGVVAGDELDVTLELDTEPRQLEVPDDFASALAAAPEANAFFDELSFSQRRWFVESVTSAKKPETRERRIATAIERLASGRGQR